MRPPNAKPHLRIVGGLMQVSTPKTPATPEAWGKKRHFYKPLPKEFRRDDFTYRLIARERDVAIYEQIWNGNEDSAAFEVIRIRKREGFQIGVRFVKAAEVYPNSESWGLSGWTYTDNESAVHKLREIINALQKESANPVKKSPIQNTERCSESIKLRGDVKNRRDG
jgi:hypothetical protein